MTKFEGGNLACEGCKREVDWDDDGVIYAVERLAVTSMDDDVPQFVDGQAGFFHSRCFPSGSQRWSRRDKPPKPADALD